MCKAAHFWGSLGNRDQPLGLHRLRIAVIFAVASFVKEQNTARRAVFNPALLHRCFRRERGQRCIKQRFDFRIVPGQHKICAELCIAVFAGKHSAAGDAVLALHDLAAGICIALKLCLCAGRLIAAELRTHLRAQHQLARRRNAA